MDARLARFLLREFKRELKHDLAQIENRLNSKLIDIGDTQDELKKKLDDLSHFKAKVIGGSLVLSFLVTTAIAILFNK